MIEAIMKIISKLYDKKIDSDNYIVEVNYRDYLKLARKILENNEFQRNKVTSSNNIYRLLREDMKVGCIFPPIVLASKISKEEFEKASFDSLDESKFLILDGLQRTHALIEAEAELSPNTSAFHENILRLEILFTANKTNVLYRMLTLNTGQTKMPKRHQIEILYSDLSSADIPGIRIIKQVDRESPKDVGDYKFNDLVEGFNAYIDQDPFPFREIDILDELSSIEKFSTRVNQEDEFIWFLNLYNTYLTKLCEIFNDVEIETDKSRVDNNAFRIFSKAQSISAFGSILQNLKQSNNGTIDNVINNLSSSNPQADFEKLFKTYLEIQTKAQKIGNEQRIFLKHFHNSLLNPLLNETFMKIDKSISKAKQMLDAEYGRIS